MQNYLIQNDLKVFLHVNNSYYFLKECFQYLYNNTGCNCYIHHMTRQSRQHTNNYGNSYIWELQLSAFLNLTL